MRDISVIILILINNSYHYVVKCYIIKLIWSLSCLILQAEHDADKLDEVDDAESDSNNSDIWLAELNLSSVTQPHEGQLLDHRQSPSPSEGKQEDDSIKVEQLVTSALFTEGTCQGRLGNIPSANLPVARHHPQCTPFGIQQKQGSYQDAHTNFDLSKPCKASSPVQSTALKTSSPLPKHRHPTSSLGLGDIFNFSGEVDLFEDSFTEGDVFSHVVLPSEELCLDAVRNSTNQVPSLPWQALLSENLQSANISACKTLLHKEQGPPDDETQIFESNHHQEIYPNFEIKPLETKPPKPPQTTTPKARGSILKDRLKSRMLQNASHATPVNNLEELRNESISKARLEASQIRREGLVDGIGPFYGLPSKVQELLSTNRKITKLYGT